MLHELNDKFAIAGLVEFDSGAGSLPRVRLTTPQAEAQVYLHGATVNHYKPADGLPVLFRTGHSLYRQDKAIRGGVPICFPWFGAHESSPAAPAHGFTRFSTWTVEATERLAGSSARVILRLQSSESTRKHWPGEFVARYTVTAGAKLEMSLEVTNTGAAAFDFTEALHTYLRVGDSRQISITGLEKSAFWDKVAGQDRPPTGEPIVITGETDRVYFDTSTTCIVHDTVNRRRIAIAKSGSASTVVWNPWIDKSKALADFGDDEWQQMVCVETANVMRNRVTLAPAKSHTMSATVSVEGES